MVHLQWFDALGRFSAVSALKRLKSLTPRNVHGAKSLVHLKAVIPALIILILATISILWISLSSTTVMGILLAAWIVFGCARLISLKRDPSREHGTVQFWRVAVISSVMAALIFLIIVRNLR